MDNHRRGPTREQADSESNLGGWLPVCPTQNIYVRGSGAKTVDLETKLELASPRTIARARSNRAFAGGEYDDEYWYDSIMFEIEELYCFSV